MAFRLRYIAFFILFLWAVEIINFFSGHALIQYGILPRVSRGIPGILFSAFIHAGFRHIIANTAPLAILGSLILTRGAVKFLKVTIFVILLGGTGVWIFGREAYHVGASGLIFGYFGYLVFRGWFAGSLSSIFISGVTVFIYGGLIWGILPSSPYISWEGHLSGFIAGAVYAKFDKKTR